MAYTSTDPSTLGTSLVNTALDLVLEHELRAQPMFRALADKRPAMLSNRGDSIAMQFHNDMSPVTTPLTETVDPTAVALPSTDTVTVTLQEYGNAVEVTQKLELTAFSNVNLEIAEQIAWNCRDSIDAIVAPVLAGGSHYIRVNSAAIKSDMLTGASGTTGAVTSTDVFTSKIPRLAVTKMRANKVRPRQGDLFACFLAPEVEHDLRIETGDVGWREPHNFSGAEAIWQGRVGVYEGCYYITTPRMPSATDGNSSTRVYRTFFLGRQALAEAVALEPQLVFGPQTDKLRRFTPVGWKALIGWNRYREDALVRAETASSVS